VAVSVVQSASATANATSLTVTLRSPVAARNTVCASVSAWDGMTGTFTVALTLGSSPDNWGLCRHYTRTASGTNSYASVWADPDCAGGANTVTITLSGATGGLSTGMAATVYEVAGLPGATEDANGATGGNSAAYGTGSFSPVTTAAADEFWFCCVTTENGSDTITGPAGWTNTASLNTGSTNNGSMSGYQCTSATGSPVYSGTIGGAGCQWAVAGATLMAGTAAGVAGPEGTGTLGAAGALEGSAADTGTGTLAAAGISAPPGTAPESGAGTLDAAGVVIVGDIAAASGTGTLTAAGAGGVPLVVNQWAGSITQNPVFGPSLPGLAEIALPLTRATSVGGGSGAPTQGNWLFTIAGWRQSPGSPPATVNVADDTHAWWRPAAPSSPTGLTRTVIWYQPNIGAVTNNPAYIYVAPNGYTAGMAVLVVEVSGIGTWDEVAGVETAYSAATRSLSLTVTL
jgi:hypothetical protein